MDTTTSIIGFAILLLTVIPLVYAIRVGNKSKRHLTKNFHQKSKAFGLVINEHEIWRTGAIGVDKQANRLFYIHKLDLKNDAIDEVENIDLNSIKKCEIIQESTSGQNGQDSKANKIGLLLVSKNSQTADLKLEFFNSSITPELDYDHQRSQKWKDIIINQTKK